jgi:antitoxin HicB
MKIRTIDNVDELIRDNEIRIATYPIQLLALPETDGGGYEAVYPPLARSVVGYGPTELDALADLKAVTPLFLKVIAENNQRLPEFELAKDHGDYSGKFNVRVPKVLHAELVHLAQQQGVSLNALVQTLMTSGATALASGRLFDQLLTKLSSTNRGT